MSTKGKVYDWDEKPTGTTWVNEFTADQAKEQCDKWGLPPGETLEENRVTLKNFIKQAGSVPQPSGSGTTTQNPVEPNQWMHIVTATAQAIGAQIAEAFVSQAQAPGNAVERANEQFPRVLQDMVQSAPQCSGMEAQQLLKFIANLNQIEQLKLASDKQILIALLPKTSGQMRAVWSDTLLRNLSLQQLKSALLTTFLPDRAKQQLISQTVYRVQGQNETISEYINSVKEATS